MLTPTAPQAAGDARTGQAWTLLQRLKNHAIFLGVRGLLPLLDRLPQTLLLALGRATGLVAYALARRPRATAHANLALVLPQRDTGELARSCFRRAGENLALSLMLRRRRLRALDLVVVPPESRAVLGRSLAEGRGAVFVSAHLGPFELVAAVVAELGYQPAVVVRESYDARLDRLVDRHRLLRGVQVIHRGRDGAALRIVRALRSGRPVGFLPDLGGRVPSAPGQLLGQRVDVPTGPQRVALRADCPVLVGTLAPVVGAATDPGPRPGGTSARFTLQVTRLHERNEERLAHRICETLSERIAAIPEQWLWMAPRFRLLQRNRA